MDFEGPSRATVRTTSPETLTLTLSITLDSVNPIPSHPGPNLILIWTWQSLFEDCRELAPAFQQMLRRPSKLRLVLNEAYPGGQRPATGDGGPAPGAPLYEVSQWRRRRRRLVIIFYVCIYILVLNSLLFIYSMCFVSSSWICLLD